MFVDKKHLGFSHTQKSSQKNDRKGSRRGGYLYDQPDRKISVFLILPFNIVLVRNEQITIFGPSLVEIASSKGYCGFC